MNKLLVGLLGLAIAAAAVVIGYVAIGGGDKPPAAQQQAQTPPQQAAPQPTPQPAPQPTPPAAPQAAPAKPLPASLAPMDTNGDGAVDLAEFLSFRMRVFDALDANKDAVLTKDEFIKLAEAPYVPANATNLPPLAERQKFLAADFDRIDTNKDGKISKQEAQIQFTYDFQRGDLDNNGKLDADDLNQAPKRIAKLDFIDAELKRYDDATPNKDGKLTFDQFIAAARKENPQPPSNMTAEQFESALRAQFAEMDENKDKIVSREEYLTYVETRFKALDCTGDGFLDEADTKCVRRVAKADFIANEMARFDSADVNKDSRVTLAEYTLSARRGVDVTKDREEQFRKAVETQFKQLDTKKAGFLARADYQVFIAKRFEELDKNKDDFLDENEMPQPAPPAPADTINRADFVALEVRRYLTADANGDGAVTLDEFLAAALKAGDRPAKVTDVQVREAATRQFQTIDANKDGKLTKEEIAAAADKQFTAMDENKDGILTPPEVDKFRNQPRDRVNRQEFITLEMGSFARADRNGDGRLALEEMLATIPVGGTAEQREQIKGAITLRFNQLDTNRDGFVSREEYAASIGAMFDQMDANRDGWLDQGEVNRFRAAQQGGARPPQPAPGPQRPPAGQPRPGAGPAPAPSAPPGQPNQPVIVMPPPTPIR